MQLDLFVLSDDQEDCKSMERLRSATIDFRDITADERREDFWGETLCKEMCRVVVKIYLGFWFLQLPKRLRRALKEGGGRKYLTLLE